MTVWSQVMLKSDQIKMQIVSQYDGIHFPIEVRSNFADVIEAQIYSVVITETDPHFKNAATDFLKLLILEIKKRNVNLDDFLLKTQMENAVLIFQQYNDNSVVQLYTFLRRFLNFEKQLITPNDIPLNDDDQLTYDLNQLHLLLQKNHNYNQVIFSDCETFSYEYHELTIANIELEQIPSSTEQTELIKKRNIQIEISFNQIVHKILQLETDFENILEMISNVLSKLISKHINQWKINQCFIGHKQESIDELNKIQEWFESLADIIWKTREQIKLAIATKSKLQISQPNLRDYLPQRFDRATSLLSMLVTNSFIIEQQPPQVMKKSTKFSISVRLLTGSKLNIASTEPEVTVTLISEHQAQITSSHNKPTSETSGKLLNNKCNMENRRNSLVADFRNIQLKTIKRTEKRGMETVMDEKFTLLFQTDFNVGQGDLVFSVWTLSLPVVVTVHGNQESQSWATITWDNAFYDPSRSPFHVSDKVKWPILAKAINAKFTRATEKPLSEQNLTYLCEKIFGRRNINANQMEISWSQFCKEFLPTFKFTFWEWFYSLMKLTNSLRSYWKADLIMGFIHKKQAEQILIKCIPGTFLLRYSDSVLGGISIAMNGSGKPMMLKPFSAKDFNARSLADRIKDLKTLTTLYPNRPKDNAFGVHYTSEEDDRSIEYINWELLITVPGLNQEFDFYNPDQDHEMITPYPDPDSSTLSPLTDSELNSIGITNNQSSMIAEPRISHPDFQLMGITNNFLNHPSMIVEESMSMHNNYMHNTYSLCNL